LVSADPWGINMRKSTLYEMAKKEGMRVSAKAWAKLDEKIKEMFMKAIENAKADKRKTVMDRDFE